MFRKLSLILMLVLAGIGSKTFAQTTVVIGDNLSANEKSSFYDALQYIHGLTNPGEVTIQLTKDTYEDNQLSLKGNDNIVLKNDSGTSHSMIFRNVKSPNCAITVPDNSTLTIGGGSKPIIIRASQNTNNGAYFYSTDILGYPDNAGVLIKVAGGTLNINDNVELCYGDNVIWMKKEDSSSPVSPVVNMHGGVIHSATKICVNIVDGTFNMDGGYICGHYFTGGNVVPDLSKNPLLDYQKLRQHFGHSDSQEGRIPKDGIKEYLTSRDAYNTAYSNLNKAMGVLVEKNSNSGTEAAPSTKFNMSGGAICGIYGDKNTTFYANDIYIGYNQRKLYALAVWVNKSEFDFSGGRIYACCAGTDGPGILLANSEFDSGQSENFNWGHVNMSGTASVSYCQSALNGGGVRVEKGVTFTMSGGEISHCVTSADDFTTNGGGGGVRMVSSKFVMSGDAEICYNYSTGQVEAYNGGGIAAVWQNGFGNFHTKLELNGGKIHHNHADSYGGGVVATDKGQGGSGAGIDVIFNGVQIYGNTSETNGGGVYVGGSADFEIKGNTKIFDNTTKGLGGGMYVSSASSYTGSVTASACEIYNNHAGSCGGGLYSTGKIIISQNSTITGNTAGSKGGGIYVGNAMEVGSGNLSVRNNKCGAIDNDVYLPTGKYITITDADFRPIALGIYTETEPSKGNVNVLYCKISGYQTILQNIYNGMKNGTYNIYDDRQQYQPVYSTGQYIAFGVKNKPWTFYQAAMSSSPLSYVEGTTDVYKISNAQELTAFMLLTNGIKDCGEYRPTADTDAKGKLTADIDMIGQYWTPIGCSNAFTGELDGDGHTISGLTMLTNSFTPIYNPQNLYGLLGNVGNGATIKNLILSDVNIVASGTSDVVGGVAANNGGSIINSTINGQLAAAGDNYTYTTRTMGGFVGTNTGNLKNSFATISFTDTESSCHSGGLAGTNSGTIENCYIRTNAGSLPDALLAYNNNGTIRYCYAPENPGMNLIISGTAPKDSGTFSAPKIFSYDIANDNRVSNSRLVYLLNDYVAHPNAVSKDAVLDSWVLPTITTVNGGLPVLKLSGAIAVGSANGTALDYASNEDELVAMLNGYATGGISLYANADLSGKTVTQGNATFAIHPSVSVKQGVNSANIRALVNIAMQYTSGTKYYHGISSPIASWPLGFAYGKTDQVPYNDNKNPCLAYMDITGGIFPQDVNIEEPEVTSSLHWDFYDFQESTSHWVNYRRNSLSHWDKLNNSTNLNYTNHATMQAAKGYLAALALPNGFNNDSILLQHEGVLNYGAITVPVSLHSGLIFPGINMVGNPYESYLDFDLFADNTNNKALWNGTPFFGVYDKDKGFVYYTPGASENYPETASRYIHKHQGFFVRLDNCAETENSLQFTEDMRTNEGQPHFRESQPNYPLVNLIVTDSEGAIDVCVVEMNRPDEGGALKLIPMVMSNGVLYAHRNGNDYGIVFTDGQENVPLWFETNANESFTLTWNTRHGEFSYLHLIDNIAGADIDMLTSQQYTFAANASDYKSRFKLVCQCTGVDENTDTDTESAEVFAFVNDGQLIVNGDGLLQIFDLNGRMLQQTILDGTMNAVSLPEVATGLYMLKLNGKTQKIMME